MPSALARSEDEPPRKRLRKGTRSCWECKRRKSRCILTSENDSVCTGCLARGSKCLSQLDADREDGTLDRKSTRERLGRLESLVETLIDKVDNRCERIGYVPRCDRGTRESLAYDVLPPSSSQSSNLESAPIFSLFHNAVVERRPADEAGPLDEAHTASGPDPTLTSKRKGSMSQSKIERTRQSLFRLFPSREEIEAIIKATMDFWIVWQRCFPPPKAERNQNSCESFDIKSMSQRHPTFIACRLLHIAVSIQHLPGDFDWSLLKTDLSAQDLVEDYMLSVSALVTSDDEIVGTLEGLDCLTLQGEVHLNSGKPRRAWLSFRRAMNIAQVMGLNRSSTRSAKGSDELLASRKARLWSQIFQSDRYLGLILGFAYGIRDEHCEADKVSVEISLTDLEEMYPQKLAVISGLVIDRNQGVNPPTFASTEAIDEKLSSAAKEMPTSWWEIPSQPVENTDDIGAINRRVIVQIWHYQVEFSLHQPFMLHSASDRRYEYSRLTCLAASREMIKRFVFLRESTGLKCHVCKMIDFQIFSAAVAVLLNLLGLGGGIGGLDDQQQTIEDWTLVGDVIRTFQSTGPKDGDVMASQVLKTLETLVGIGQNDGSDSRDVRLTIPYFGTIAIERGKKFQAANFHKPSARFPLLTDFGNEIVPPSPPRMFIPLQNLSSRYAPAPFKSNLGISIPTETEQFPIFLGNPLEGEFGADLYGDWNWAMME